MKNVAAGYLSLVLGFLSALQFIGLVFALPFLSRHYQSRNYTHGRVDASPHHGETYHFLDMNDTLCDINLGKLRLNNTSARPCSDIPYKVTSKDVVIMMTSVLGVVLIALFVFCYCVKPAIIKGLKSVCRNIPLRRQNTVRRTAPAARSAISAARATTASVRVPASAVRVPTPTVPGAYPVEEQEDDAVEVAAPTVNITAPRVIITAPSVAIEINNPKHVRHITRR
ncbi:hypothetical protein B0T24DRAFT_592091 [Lasiosphaeria ovina]|uniref:Uncharacterized protein n=1 Tax=Lasiosphaeria ovina TaxID=92902 RepID=A0AAE0KHT2_9PEZI|nr:hypothetical protein B0T24DRAFT_592091 [Lasiosphaeria ovina]